MFKKCQICNKPSGVYPLCFIHMKMKKDGKDSKAKKTTTSKLTIDPAVKNEISNIKETEVKINNLCIVCEENAPNGPQCRSCYYETREHKQQIDKNSKLQELSSYYYNLNGNIFRMSDFAKISHNERQR